MGAIVTYEFYSDVYKGTETDETSFPALSARAEDVIGAMTRWAVTPESLPDYPLFVQTLYKKAICAQTDFLALNGEESATGGMPNGFIVGKVSVHERANTASAKSGAMAAAVSPMAIMYLEQTGLMNPQVDVLPDVSMIGGWYGC